MRQGLPDVALNREGMRDHDSTAIAVGIISWIGTKPSDIHVADGDLELADGERHGPVDSKLVLLVAVGEASRLRRQLIEPACRNRVTHVAGSHRQELCRPNREVNLCDRCLVRRCKTHTVSDRSVSAGVLSTTQDEARTARRVLRLQVPRWSRYVYFLGNTRCAQRQRTDHQSARPDTAQTFDSSHCISLRLWNLVGSRNGVNANVRSPSRTRQNCGFSAVSRQRPCAFARCVRFRRPR